MKNIVQKFGGTSIGKAEGMINVLKIVMNTIEQDYKPVVVLSAMSSYIKAEGTTSRLMEAAEAAINDGAYFKIIDNLQEYHFAIIEKVIENRSLKEQIKEEVTLEFKKLKSFLDAVQIIEEISPRSLDVVVSTGEKLSARIFAAALNSRGIDAEYVNLENIIDKHYADVNQEFCAYLQKKMAEIIEECKEKIPVVTGFFGFVPNGILKAIGRGYTDFTAALIAAGIGAQELQIWKEVDGIFSADPKKVTKARVIPVISPDEASELTYFGSEVIHPFTMEQVINKNIPVRIKNTFDPSLPGTIISKELQADKNIRKCTAVTVKRDIIIINVHSNRMLMAYGFMTKVFDVLNKHEIVIDLISTSEVNISMTVNKSSNLEKAVADLKKLGKVSIIKNMAILSLVGRGMKKAVGVAGDMFVRLAKKGVNIEMISQGASEINISCVINVSQCDKALKAVHEMLEN